MRFESNKPIFEISDKDLSAKLNMKPGCYYCYFKPSFINGYGQFVDKDINFNYL